MNVTVDHQYLVNLVLQLKNPGSDGHVIEDAVAFSPISECMMSTTR